MNASYVSLEQFDLRIPALVAIAIVWLTSFVSMNIHKRIIACSLWVLLTTFCVGQETVDPSENRLQGPVVESSEKAGKADQFSRDAFVQIKTDRKAATLGTTLGPSTSKA